MNLDSGHPNDLSASSPRRQGKMDKEFTFPCELSVSEDENEVTESTIRVFLDEKALDLKKLQTPLYEEFYNTLNGSSPLVAAMSTNNETSTNYLKFFFAWDQLSKLPPKSRSPSRTAGGSLKAKYILNSPSPGIDNKNLQDVPLLQLSEWRGILDSQQQPISPRVDVAGGCCGENRFSK